MPTNYNLTQSVAFFDVIEALTFQSIKSALPASFSCLRSAVIVYVNFIESASAH